MAYVIDFKEPSLWFALAHILFNPIFWNTAARQGKKEEHHDKTHKLIQK